jgi:hypothetical protein
MLDHIPYGCPDPILAKVAREHPIEKLILHILGMRSHGENGQHGDEQLRAVVNGEWLVAIAAEARQSSDVAAFATALDSCGEHDLAEYALDVAAASKEPDDLAALAADLAGANKSAMFLRAVVRRRLPQDVAAVMCGLSEGGEHGLAEKLLAGLVDAGYMQDMVRVVIGIRTDRCDQLADEVSKVVTAGLKPTELATFVLGLRIHQDHRSATHAIEAALGWEVGHVADLIRHLFLNDKDYADSVVDKAVDRLAPADKLVLASLLEEELPPEIASAIWAKIVPGLEGNTFVDAFDIFAQYAGLPAVHRALHEAAKVHSIERIAALVLQVNAKMISDGVCTIFKTVVQCRPIGEIDQLADRLRDSAYTGLAWRLLDLAIETVHQRPGAGDAAKLIDALLTRVEELERRGRFGRDEPRRWRQRIPGIISRIAHSHNADHLMGLIDGLVRCGRYDDYRKVVEDTVADEYRIADLTLLSTVQGYKHLPVVMDIICRSLWDSRRVASAEIPVVVSALRNAGARDDHLRMLLEYTGYRRDLEQDEIIAALKQAGLMRDADSVFAGHLRRVKRNRVKAPRFFVP